MNLQPSLEGRLLRLRPLLPADFEPLFAVSSDPKVWEQHPERLRYQRPVFENFFAAALESKGALVAIDLANGEMIGSSRYSGLRLEESRVEVGYTFLARRCWGRGFNAEMKKLMLDHAFQAVDEVFFYVGGSNWRSRTAMERVGATLVRTIERTPLEGAPYTSVEFRIRKAEWARD